LPSRERRRQLVEAATRVIADVGLDAATTRMIAAEAGAPLSSLNYTFKDKGELLAGVYEHLLERSGDMLTRLVTEGCGLEAGARSLTLGFFEDTLANESLVAANYEILFWSIRTQGSDSRPTCTPDTARSASRRCSGQPAARYPPTRRPHWPRS
jgi:AcrR family transcriptional regulator